MNNNLTVFSTELIPVYTTDTGKQVVVGRELHTTLGIGRDYSTWFKGMCEKYSFEENTDYYEGFEVFPKSGEQNVHNLNTNNDQIIGASENRGGRNRKEHILTLDTAKEIAMVQQSPIGKAIRKKLIELEKKFREQTKQGSVVDLRSILDSDSSLKLLAETATALVTEREKTRTLMLECSVKDEKIAVLEPKANYYDLILQSSEALTVSQIAEDYGISPQAFNNLLKDFRIQRKVNGQWVLYQPYKGKGYTVPRTYNYANPNGSQGSNTLTCWTQKGRVFLYNLLKEKGIVPTIEKEAHAE